MMPLEGELPLSTGCSPTITRSWCKNSKTLFHCSTLNTSALVLFYLYLLLVEQLVSATVPDAP
jgi:hypothetical protein